MRLAKEHGFIGSGRDRVCLSAPDREPFTISARPPYECASECSATRQLVAPRLVRIRIFQQLVKQPNAVRVHVRKLPVVLGGAVLTF